METFKFSPYLILRVMLTCALRAQVKDLKKELKHVCCIEKNKFLTFQDIKCTIFKNKFLHLTSKLLS